MAVIAKATAVRTGTSSPNDSSRVGSGLICGEDLAKGDACYIKQADGLVYKSGGSGVTALTQEGAAIHGYAATDCKIASKDAVTLYDGIDWVYGSGLTAGKPVYLDVSAATTGRLNDTSGITSTIRACGYIIDATRIRLKATLQV